MNRLRALIHDDVKLYRDRAGWRIAFYPIDGGTRRFMRLTASTEREARAQRDRLRDAMRADATLRTGTPSTVPTLAQWSERFPALHPDLSQASLANIAKAARRLVAQVGGGTRIDAITTEDARGFCAGLTEFAPATRASLIRHAKWLFSAAVKLGHLEHSPFRHESVPSAEEARWEYVDEATTRALMRACPSEGARALVALARWAGLRRQEAVRLVWGDIDLGRRRLTVRAGGGGEVTTKSRTRLVPIEPRLAAFLASLSPKPPRAPFDPARPVAAGCGGPSGSYKHIRAARAAAGLAYPQPLHALRKSRQTDWIEAGHDVFAVARWMGNSVLVAQKHYHRTTEEAMDKAAFPDPRAPGRAKVVPSGRGKRPRTRAQATVR